MKRKKDLVYHKKRYDLVRHHAWAGLGFLSVLLAIRILYPGISELIQPILIIIIIYIVISLFLTYKYYRGSSYQKTNNQVSEEVQKEQIRSDVEKQRLKLEKKKIKAEAKVEKKSSKKEGKNL